MATDLGLDPGHERPPPDHPPYVGLEQGITGQLAGPASGRAKERSFAVIGDAGGRDVILQICRGMAQRYGADQGVAAHAEYGLQLALFP